MDLIDKNEEKDDFWNIEKLIPKKKSPTLSPFATRPMVKEVSIDSPTLDKAVETHDTDTRMQDRKLTTITSSEYGEERIYYPQNTLIKQISVKKYKESYDFYDSFRKAALLYFDCPGEKCEFAQFYSYMPQYSQLTKPQKSYYFYWRSEFRHGRFIKTDYSYLYLYVYEIINLPDVIEPERGLKLLCRLWREYRAALPRIDMYFSIWVRDYCFVHGLPCPITEIQDFISAVIKNSDFKEFYFTGVGQTSRDGVWSTIAYLSDYDWQRGFNTVVGKPGAEDYNKRAEIYKTLFEGSMRAILPVVWEKCMSEKDDGKIVRIARSAFPNTLCTHSVKCRLEIEYYPLANATVLRDGITAAVRYTENKLRALFGTKSRIAVKYIPSEYKELLDCYFDDLVHKSEQEAKRRNLPEYEKQYDAPREKLSFSGADEIERASWNTTIRLCDTEEYGDDELSVPEVSVQEVVLLDESKQTNENTYGLSNDEISYVRTLYNASEPMRCGIDDEAMVERINEAFSDGFGDVIIEDTGDGFAIIEDYKQEIAEWLQNI